MWALLGNIQIVESQGSFKALILTHIFHHSLCVIASSLEQAVLDVQKFDDISAEQPPSFWLWRSLGAHIQTKMHRTGTRSTLISKISCTVWCDTFDNLLMFDWSGNVCHVQLCTLTWLFLFSLQSFWGTLKSNLGPEPTLLDVELHHYSILVDDGSCISTSAGWWSDAITQGLLHSLVLMFLVFHKKNWWACTVCMSRENLIDYTMTSLQLAQNSRVQLRPSWHAHALDNETLHT